MPRRSSQAASGARTSRRITWSQPGQEGSGSEDVRLDRADFQGLEYGLDTSGLDGLRVGTVVDRGGEATSVRLGSTTNVEIGTIDSRNDQGDASAFDFALRLHDGAGRVGRSYPENYGTVVGERALHVGSFTSTPVEGVSIRNLRAVNADLIWMPCQGTNIRLFDVTLENTNLYWCVDSLPTP